MISLKKYLLFLVLGLTMLACEGPQGDPGPAGPQGPQGPTGQTGAIDKQIRLPLPGNITFDGSQTITSDQNNIHKFNISYYADVDSVFYTIYSSVTGVENKCFIELYNVTDNKPIDGSLITASSNTEPILLQSGNIVKGFPNKEITVGIRIRGQNAGQAVNAVSGYLYLYRK